MRIDCDPNVGGVAPHYLVNVIDGVYRGGWVAFERSHATVMHELGGGAGDGRVLPNLVVDLHHLETFFCSQSVDVPHEALSVYFHFKLSRIYID